MPEPIIIKNIKLTPEQLKALRDSPPGEIIPWLPSPAQEFFSNLAAEARRPHTGDAYKQFLQRLLIQAEEAGLYVKEP